jgi:hypothetical protein
MTNKTKLLLSSLVLATSSMALVTDTVASESPIVLDLDKSIESNGTINVGAGMTIKVSQGNWITNNGVFNFYRANDNDKFNIMGTGSEGSDSSGIKNNGSSIEQIDGSPKVESTVSGTAYYNFKDGTGEMWVINTTTNEKSKLSSADYNKLSGGTITDESMSLYSFLKTNEWTITSSENARNNIIVLRGTREIEATNNVVSLDHNYPGVNPTTAEQPLLIKTPFVNSDDFSVFTKNNVDLDEYSYDYGLLVKGYYNFSGNNSEFSGKSVEFAEGETKIAALHSMFPQDELNVTGGKLTLDLNTYQQNEVLNFDKTINVKSHVEGEEGSEQTIYGCLKITNTSNFSLAEGGVLNLGVIPPQQQEEPQEP